MGPKLSDSDCRSRFGDRIEREQLGPRRHIARLGVIFDRQRANAYLGGSEQARRSAPMLLVRTFSAGTELVYEMRNLQRLAEDHQSSRIDYVRPAGSGGDLLLVTYGRPGAAVESAAHRARSVQRIGVLVPIADLRQTHPGGPIEGMFTAPWTGQCLSRRISDDGRQSGTIARDA